MKGRGSRQHYCTQSDSDCLGSPPALSATETWTETQTDVTTSITSTAQSASCTPNQSLCMGVISRLKVGLDQDAVFDCPGNWQTKQIIRILNAQDEQFIHTGTFVRSTTSGTINVVSCRIIVCICVQYIGATTLSPKHRNAGYAAYPNGFNW